MTSSTSTKKAGEAVVRAREGGGPTLLDCKTYRTRPHAEGMRDTGYRTREELDAWRARDPIEMLAGRLIEGAIADREALDRIESEIRTAVEEGVEFARTSPWPDPATVTDHVFSG
jgi:2-oxoisovalerate dehydrogenase E1 component